MRAHRGILVHHVSGMVQQRGAHDFDRPVNVISDRRKRKKEPEEAPQVGFFWQLEEPYRDSLVTAARRERPKALSQARADKQAHDEEKLQRREEAVQSALDRVVDRYAAAA